VLGLPAPGVAVTVYGDWLLSTLWGEMLDRFSARAISTAGVPLVAWCLRLHGSRRVAVLLLGLLTLCGVGTAGAAATNTLHGRMVILHGDPRNPSKPDTAAWLFESGGRQYQLRGVSKRFQIGERVTVTGTVTGDTIAVSQVQTAPAPQTTVSGSFSALVMLVYWTSPDSETSSVAQQQIQSVDGPWFNQTSYGAVTGRSATATPWMQIAPISNCDTTAITSEAESAAQAAGYSPSSYDRELFYFPYSPDCKFGGAAYVPGRDTWYNGWFDTYVTTHELGHNFGLWHSHLDNCIDPTTAARVTLNSNCTTEEYGDSSDDMGNNNPGGEYNASQKNLLGWMAGRSADVSSSSTYTLSPYESTQAGLTQALHIVAPEGDFWVEYRQPTGPDSELGSALTAGVNVHLTDPGNGSWILDMQPNQDPSWITDQADGTSLIPGTSWTDPAGVFTLTTNSATSSGASVTVTFHGGAPGALRAQFIVPSVMSTATSPTDPYSLVWTPGSCPTGATYTLQESVNNGTFGTVFTGTATAATQSLLPGNLYAFQVSCGGSPTSTTFRLNGFQEGSASYTGTWTSTSFAGAWGGTARYSVASGASATFTCTCEAFAWVSDEGSSHGSAKVYVDGVLRKTVNTQTSANKNRVVVFKYGWSTDGSHTMKIVNLATAGHPRVNVDGFLTRTSN
jgi:Gametolysin peptidase M11